MRAIRVAVVGSLALVVAALLAGCGRAPAGAEPTVGLSSDPVATSVRQTLEALAVAGTVTALTAQGQETQPPATAPVATDAALPPPTDSAPPAATSAPSSPGQCTVVSGVNLRPGPGTAYDPPLAGLGPNTTLRPLAFSPVGYPLGQWLQVEVLGTGQIGWVSAGPQWISCDSDVAALQPPAIIPPTPQPQSPLPTATATRVVAAAPDIDNDAPGGSFPSDHVFGQVIVDPTFLFRMDVRDLNVGDFEGAGTVAAEFSITGNGVDYFRREGTAGYCVFGGGEPTCRPWPVDAQGRYTWGEGGPVVESGEYFASITVTAEQEDPTFGTVWNWNFPFRVTLP